MGRLINEDALIEAMKKNFSSKFLDLKQFEKGSKSFMECFIETIKSVPTTYDVENVVSEINNSENWCNAEMMYPEVAEEIIRKGGV